MDIQHTPITITDIWSVLKRLKHTWSAVCCFAPCSGTLVTKLRTNWRLCFPFVHCSLEKVSFNKGVFSMGLPLLWWNNTVLVASHLHPLKTTLCHLFKTWALNRKFDFYRSNYGGFTSPLAVLPCRNHANRALHLTLPCSNRGVNDYSYLKENHSLKKKKKKNLIVSIQFSQ